MPLTLAACHAEWDDYLDLTEIVTENGSPPHEGRLAFLSSIEKTLQKHMPPHAQGPMISNALSTAFQFQMSVWCMVGEECIRPVRAKHSDWCGLAGIVQAIVKTFPKNCALMFPSLPPPPSVALFSSTFRLQSSDDDDDDDGSYDAGSSFRRV